MMRTRPALDIRSKMATAGIALIVLKRHRTTVSSGLGLAFTIIAAAVLLRTHLGAFPLNNDEAIYVLYSHVAAYPHRLRDLFGAFEYAVPPLFMWIGAIALRLNADPSAQVVTIRYLSVLSGLGTIVGLYLLAWQLYRDVRLGALAGVLYAFCPYAVMFNRIGMLDSFVGFIGILVAIQSVRAFQQRATSVRRLVLLGVLLGLGQLAKGTAIFFWLLPILSWYFLDPERSSAHLRRAISIATPVAVVLYLTILGSGDVRNLFRPFFTAIKYTTGTGTSPVHSNFNNTALPILSSIVFNLSQWISWQDNYVGLALTALLAIALCATAKSHTRADKFLALWLLIPLALMLFTKVYDSRYVVFTVPIELLLVSRAVFLIWQYSRQLWHGHGAIPLARAHRGYRFLGGGLIALLAACLIYIVPFDASHDARLVGDPLHGYYDPFDRWYYVDGWLSGYGLDNVEAYIRDQGRSRNITVVTDNRFFPLVGLRFAFANDPHIHIQVSSAATGLALPVSAPPSDALTLAVLDVPKDTLSWVLQVHPTWRVALVQNKPGGQSQFIVLSNAA